MISHMKPLCLRLVRLDRFHTLAIRKYYTPRDNSGIYRRVKLISEDEPDVHEAEIDQQSLHELEEDLMKAGEMNDEILRDISKISKAHQFKIIERKFFKPPKEPNMLTWSEKEQIRLLHQNDPENWTPETLSCSFPASPSIIKKLLRNRWRPPSSERVKEHDRNVSENWIAFHQGQLEINDPKLKAHLTKFTDRKNGINIISDEEAVKVTEIILPKPKRTEFLSLVTSFKSPEEDNLEIETSSKQKIENKLLDGNPYLQSDGNSSSMDILHKSQANYTLDQFRKRLREEADNLSKPDEDIKAIIRGNRVENQTPPTYTYVAPSERFKTDAIAVRKSKRSPLQLIDPDNINGRITIPKEKWKPGVIYRVSDCFYNDKGYFLYRVPGLKA